MKNLSFGIYTLILLLLIFGAKAQKLALNQPANFSKKQEVQFFTASQLTNSKIIYKIISVLNQTWCYKILAVGKMMIHPSAFELSGNEGFGIKVAEKKVDDLVIQKIKNGEMPPSAIKKEMQKIGTL